MVMNATTIGTVAEMYVPTIGMNAATDPSKKASAAAPGIPTILSTTKKKLPLTPASKSRE